MSKSRLVTFLYIALIFIGTARVYMDRTENTAVMPAAKKHIVLDAGHGGFDPGKVAADGTAEKDINLDIMRLLQGYLEQGGADVSITRLRDEALAGKKGEDMKNRLAAANADGADVFVSIHQNSYPSENVRGAQVFYYKGSENGKRLAEAVQLRLKEYADGGNKRSAKANDSYYILKNTDIPSIIVECGFLSSPDENEKLKTADYQKKIAWAIYAGITDYFAAPEM